VSVALWTFVFGLLSQTGISKALSIEVIDGGGNYMIDRWDVADGLPGTQVLSWAQTTDGYLWVGTVLGVARFDGLGFTVFDAETPGVSATSGSAKWQIEVSDCQ
jgi:ligand-binding sensor domain-containing protein